MELKSNTFNFSDAQTKAILELRLQKLTALEREDIQKDLESLILEIKNYLSILNSRDILLKEIENELTGIKKEFATERRSEIIDQEYEQVDDLRYIQQEDIVLTISNLSLIHI